jgi:hypothetical protein
MPGVKGKCRTAGMPECRFHLFSNDETMTRILLSLLICCCLVGYALSFRWSFPHHNIHHNIMRSNGWKRHVSLQERTTRLFSSTNNDPNGLNNREKSFNVPITPSPELSSMITKDEYKKMVEEKLVNNCREEVFDLLINYLHQGGRDNELLLKMVKRFLVANWDPSKMTVSQKVTSFDFTINFITQLRQMGFHFHSQTPESLELKEDFLKFLKESLTARENEHFLAAGSRALFIVIADLGIVWTDLQTETQERLLYGLKSFSMEDRYRPKDDKDGKILSLMIYSFGKLGIVFSQLDEYLQSAFFSLLERNIHLMTPEYIPNVIKG